MTAPPTTTEVFAAACRSDYRTTMGRLGPFRCEACDAERPAAEYAGGVWTEEHSSGHHAHVCRACSDAAFGVYTSNRSRR